MKYVFAPILSLSFALTACTNPNMDSVGNSAAQTGVYDGEITPTDNPITQATVFIYGDLGPKSFKCTGSVLSSTVILTAAHCVVDVDDALQTASVFEAGKISILESKRIISEGDNATVAKATKILVHPMYLKHVTGAARSAFNNGYDLALIHLDQPLSDSFKPVILSDKLEDLTQNQVYIAGYGDYENDENAQISFDLRHGPVTVDLSENYVKALTSDGVTWTNYITTNTTSTPNLSFKKTGNEASICHGDSGGPLYFVKDGEVHLAGVNVSMFNNKDRNNCAMEGDVQETSVSMAGPSLSFVLNSFKELTGTALPLVRDIPEMDPNTFEFYLNSPVLSSKNNIANLEGYSAAIDAKDNSLILLDQLTAATICEHKDEPIKAVPGLFVMFDPNPTSFYDGKTILPIMMSHNGVIDGVLEGRAKLEGEKLKLVVLTADGYLSAELPVKICQ